MTAAYTLSNFFASILLRVGRKSNMERKKGREGELNQVGGGVIRDGEVD